MSPFGLKRAAKSAKQDPSQIWKWSQLNDLTVAAIASCKVFRQRSIQDRNRRHDSRHVHGGKLSTRGSIEGEAAGARGRLLGALRIQSETYPPLLQCTHIQSGMVGNDECPLAARRGADERLQTGDPLGRVTITYSVAGTADAVT